MPNRIRRAIAQTTVRVVALLAMTGCALLVAGPSALAAPRPAAAPETISWTVQPADAQGPDGRAWAETTLDAGQVLTDHLAVRNLSQAPVTFAITAADGYFTDTGRFTMLPNTQPSTRAGTWITVQDTVDVPAGQTVVLPYTVTVPTNATPGDHAAGIAAAVRYTGENPGGGTIGVESRVGFRVITRVTGEVSPSLIASDVQTTYETSWNPLVAGTTVVQTRLHNDGNVSLVVSGTAEAGGSEAPFAYVDGAPTIELLPGDERIVTSRMTGVWPTGAVGVTASFVGTATDLDPVRATVGTTAWAMPWPQLVAIGVLALLLLSAVVVRRRRRAGLRRLLEAERAAGRAEASAGSVTTMSGSGAAGSDTSHRPDNP